VDPVVLPARGNLLLELYSRVLGQVLFDGVRSPQCPGWYSAYLYMPHRRW